jgi:Flp pilus assembly protein TadG
MKTTRSTTGRNRGTNRTRAERGLAIVMTGLMIIPLMIFAALGVDLAAWYARISDIQRAADAAALAGAVWMPNLTRATTEANASLRSNGFVNGVDNIITEVERGSTVTSVRVTVTDTDVDRYFSNVFRDTPATISRHAEAEYNLPLPLGSPLNYFGGDATRTVPPLPPLEYSVAWPTDYSTRAPTNGPCNVSAQQQFGRWTSTGTHQANQLYTGSSSSGNRLCTWEPVLTDVSTPPANATVLPPINVPCNRQQTPTSQLGRWNTGTPPTYTSTNRHTSGTGNRQCTWRVTTTANLRSDYNSFPPTNRPCNVPPFGRWPSSGGFQANQFHTSGTANVICQWNSQLSSTQPPAPPNPIDSTRSPGFWAAVEGPQTNAYQGDIYSTRCYGGGPSCGSVQNAQYLTGDDRGYWYVIKIPTGLTGSVAVNIFDASYNRSGNTQELAGDRALDGSSADFPTQFQVYRQTNALDFGQRTALFSGASNTTDGSCNWSVTNESSFRGQWRNLCTISGVTGGQIYLLNVQTTGSTGAGVNGYAVEAVANGSHSGTQPALYAYSAMQMQNNNFCGGSGPSCPPPLSTFYLAEVGPQYAGRVLVMELWDPGDVSGDATLTPMMPSATLPRPVVPVSALNCTFTADALPNSRLGVTGTEFTTPQGSDHATECRINTSVGGSRFNGEWVRIRINIPEDYTCVAGRNPEIQGGSCWWGIRYSFSASANDVTTWQARVEGNPLQLTQ